MTPRGVQICIECLILHNKVHITRYRVVGEPSERTGYGCMVSVQVVRRRDKNSLLAVSARKGVTVG